MALNTTPAVPVHGLHQFLLMGIQGQKKNRKIGALTYKSELAVNENNHDGLFAYQ